MKKFIIGFFLIISLAFNGFISGGLTAKYFFIHEGDGLAGAATVVVLGTVGAAIALVLSIVLLRKLEETTTLILTILSTVVSLICWSVFFW